MPISFHAIKLPLRAFRSTTSLHFLRGIPGSHNGPGLLSPSSSALVQQIRLRSAFWSLFNAGVAIRLPMTTLRTVARSSVYGTILEVCNVNSS